MNSWIGLLKKDYKVGRKWIFISLIFKVLFIAGSYFLAVKYDEATIMVVASFILVGFQSLNLGLYTYSSLNTESKYLHLWLHNPSSTWKLLLSKLLNGLLALSISLSISLVYAGYAVSKALIQHDIEIFNWNALFKIVAIALFYLVNVAIYLGVWIVLGWVLYMILKPVIGKLSGLIILIFYILSETIIDKIVNSQIFYSLTSWGELPMITTRELLSIFSTPPDGVIGNVPFIYLGQYIFYILISAGVFFAASWLIDRKVEV